MTSPTPAAGDPPSGNSGRQDDPNLPVYNRSEVAAHYASLDYLSPCEKALFDEFLKEGDAILDLGVGGGRTTGLLGAGLALAALAAQRRRSKRAP